MPLFACPNDQCATLPLRRRNVRFEMCPRCRGVWLDRADLNLLLALARTEAGAGQAPPAADGSDSARAAQGPAARSIFDIFE